MDRRSNLTEEEKAKRKESRKQTVAVRRFLEGVESNTSHRRGPRKDPKKLLEATLAQLDGEMDRLRRLVLIQQRMNLEETLASTQHEPKLEELEKGFVECAKGYSEKNGISYAAWREMGVSAKTLQASGMHRPRR